ILLRSVRLYREARWQHPLARDAKPHRGTKSESADARFCSSGSSAVAYAIARLCWNPQDRFEHTTRWSRFAPRTSIGNILLRKMIPDSFPLLVREPNHSTFISDRQQAAILR